MLQPGKKRGEVTFIFNTPNVAKNICVAGDFNQWRPEIGRMAKTKDGSFRLSVKLPPGQHEYKFVMDGQWLHDPEAPTQIGNAFGTFNSIARVPG